MSADPIEFFGAWYAEANATETNDANAMTLATVDPAGPPSARIVLLHGALGFVFYTNAGSRKAPVSQPGKQAVMA